MLKSIMKKIVYGEKADSKTYVEYLRSLGAVVGDRVNIFAPMKTNIDETRPWLLDIGNDVQITEGVTILTHGYDWSVLKGVYGDILGSSGGVSIGNNVFLGMYSTILKGVHIGDNVIIGAGSVVTKDIPDNCVAAGNPCRVIMPLDEYYEKRKAAQLDEATELVRLYRERYGKEPDDKALHEFFWLFSNKSDEMPECWKDQMNLLGNAEKSFELFSEHIPLFDSKEEFLKSIH